MSASDSEKTMHVTISKTRLVGNWKKFFVMVVALCGPDVIYD